MLDPFPFEAPAALQQAIKPFTDYMSFKTLPLHIHELLFAVLLYHVTNTVISPWLSTRLFPTIYPQFNKRTRINWDVHVVSLLQSTLINALALWVSIADDERSEMDWEGRVWGYTGASGLVVAFSCGYFVWDLYISLRYVKVFGIGLLAHAVSALSVYSFGFVRYSPALPYPANPVAPTNPHLTSVPSSTTTLRPSSSTSSPRPFSTSTGSATSST